ncbi:hypothetical protein PENTCL1PPCAC_23963, partial [Pristionchus entomophagus]
PIMTILSVVISAILAVAVSGVISAQPTRADVAKMTKITSGMKSIFDGAFGGVDGSDLKTNFKFNDGKYNRNRYQVRPAVHSWKWVFDSLNKMGLRVNYSSKNNCNDPNSAKNKALIARGGAECTFLFFPAD